MGCSLCDEISSTFANALNRLNMNYPNERLITDHICSEDEVSCINSCCSQSCVCVGVQPAGLGTGGLGQFTFSWLGFTKPK